MLEKVYPILKNDPNFVQQLETFKTDLSAKIRELKNIISKSYNMGKDFEEALLKYQQIKILSKFKIFIMADKAHKFYREIFLVYYYIPQTYFNALKFLRTSWYNH